MIALLIGFESVTRLFAPVPIHFAEAIPIACLGLAVNIASAWLLSSGGHDHSHGHSHGHAHDHEDHDHDHDDEDDDDHDHDDHHDQSGHGKAHRDNNLRAAVIHVMADAAVSVLVIVGLLLARTFGLMWMDPLAGMAGACVIASWSYGLIRDTGAILLDMNPDASVSEGVRRTIQQEGDRLTDLHIWRLGPGHLGAIVSVETGGDRDPGFYRDKLARFPTLSHVTVEVQRLT
jgi:cation diffusion facilitator family transporter